MTYAKQLAAADIFVRFEAMRRRIAAHRKSAENAQNVRKLVRLANLETAIERRETEIVFDIIEPYSDYS
jgi:hypothetical protein